VQDGRHELVADAPREVGRHRTFREGRDEVAARGGLGHHGEVFGLEEVEALAQPVDRAHEAPQDEARPAARLLRDSCAGSVAPCLLGARAASSEAGPAARQAAS
jgi:hypothetical protein